MGGDAIGRAALEATRGLADERVLLYSDLIYTSLSEANRKAMEELMAAGKYEYQSDFAKTHQALGRAEAVLAFLDARGFVVSETDKARVLACTDAAILDRWIRNAATISSVEALFD